VEKGSGVMYEYYRECLCGREKRSRKAENRIKKQSAEH
jgi:hypothetical protein